ncbi:unnamed protein product [Orchesella dallaii]|uniref:FYVE-type domain-containing protein n=1 Tax=Orchesella dallaii TaxID=48710 RepID=A0ABP1PQ27_9HEXA
MSELKKTQQAIHEGFICSKCMRSFSGVPELLVHYDKCQPKTVEDNIKQDSNSFKGFLGKAKQKLLTEPGRFLDTQILNQQLLQQQQQQQGGPEKASPTGTPVYFNAFQNVEVSGVARSHFDEFYKIRSGRLERYASEANKLKIRLSKLIGGLEKFPNLLSKSSAGLQDSVEWKAHEKSVVAWLDEKPVSRCPDCTQNFNILKRKHHCRLCGSIICQDCSMFIPLRDAIEIFEVETTLNRDCVASSAITFRVCYYCSHLIKYDSSDGAAKSSSQESSSQAKLMDLYTSLRNKMEETNQLQPQLVTIVDSIRGGDTLYSRDEANILRSKLLRISEQIDIISKQISALTNDTFSNSQLKLQQRIRQSSVAFIRDFIAKLPIVPDESEISENTSISSSCSTPRMEILDDGWCIVAPPSHGRGGSSTHSEDGEPENPIQQQIRNVKFYIEQARAAGKHDEVEMLEASLADLLIWEQESRKT